MPSSTPMRRPTDLTRQLFVALALLLVPALAGAHTGLRRSDPAKDSRLTAAPTRISLWFTARPQLAFSKIRLIGPAGEVSLDRPVADTGNLVRAEIQQPLAPGEYRVEWQTASADGHPIRGEFSFAVVAAPGDVVAPVEPHGEHEARPELHAGHSEYRAVRWMEFVALLSVLGALGFRHGVLPPLAVRGVATADAADRSRRLGQSAIGLYVFAVLIRLYTESVAIHGREGALQASQLIPMLTTTLWGLGWLVGLGGALVLAVGWAISKRTVTIGTPLALLGAVAMAFSPALSGHAASSSNAFLGVTFDVFHILAAGVWVGGLLHVLFAGVPAMRRLEAAGRDAAVATLINSFHPVALFCAPLVVIAGLGTSWLRLGGPAALWPTAYGRTLLLKLALVAAVALVGTYNAMRVRRRLGTAEGTRHIRLTGAVELLFAAIVIAVTTVLVSTPVPTEMVLP